MTDQTAAELSLPWRRLDGKVVMVTGASSGIGLEFCLDLSKAGCRVVAAARRIERLISLCDQINHLFPLLFSSDKCLNPSNYSSRGATTNARAVAVELDVSADGKSIEGAVRRAWDSFGRIDALVNNAGVREQVRAFRSVKRK